MTLPGTLCGEHTKIVHEQTELSIMFRTHAESTKQSLERILILLQGQSGADGLLDRMTKLETRFSGFMTQTDEGVTRLATAIQGKNGNDGLVGRVNRLERMWAMLIGIAIASGAAGAGFAKLFSLLGG